MSAPPHARTVRARALRGVLLLGVSALCFGGMSFLTKLAGARLPGVEIAAVRFASGLALILMLAAAGAVAVRVPRSHLWLLLLRGLFGGIAVIFFFTAIGRGTVGTATLLNFTSPIFTALFAWRFLGERLTWRVVLAFLLAGVGVTLVWRGTHVGPLQLFGWQAAALLSAVLAGAAVTTIRALRRYEAVSAWTVLLFFHAVGLGCAAPVAAWGFVWPDPREWALLAGVSLLSIAGQLVFTYALAFVQAAVAGIIQQLTVVTAFVLGTVVLHEPLGGLQLLGAGLTMVGVMWAAYSSQPRPAAPAGAAAVTSRGSTPECP